MNEYSPYEKQLQQQLNDLPLPDENMAWADMKRRLDEEDDDGIIAWWRPGCGIWGLLLLTTILIGWWIYSNRTGSATKNKIPVIQKIERSDMDTIRQAGTGKNEKAETDMREKQHYIDSLALKQQKRSAGIDTITIKINEKKNAVKQIVKKKENRKQAVISIAKAEEKRERKKTNEENKKIGGKKDTEQPGITDRKDSINKERRIDSSSVSITSATITPDIKKNREDSIIKEINKDSLVVKGNKKDSAEKASYFFTAGLALHQQLPLDGQKLTPYNSLGRKGTLLDYIPALYMRFNKKDKWFIQSEIRYGAPQYTKNILYDQKITLDTGLNPPTLVSSFRVNKTYYHQLSFSFNRYVVQNWTIGAGVSWNKFSSVIAEKEVAKRDNVTQSDTVLSKVIAREKNDSAFAKSYFQAVIETQYQWKRFSVGARYSFGLQPYLKFRLPGGNEKKENNSSGQVFLRYELWRSKQKK